MVAANTVVAREGPDVVISHEEFGALPVAKSLGFPVCFVVDFFTAENTARMETLQYADAIVFIERRGLFPEPSYLRGKVRYVGPVVRAFTATRADRGRVRSTLRVPETARLLSVIPGAWANEKRAPLFDLVTEAFRLIPGTDNCLIWIAGNDSEALATRAPDVTVLRSFAPIEELMVASDLVITKANRGTTIDAASLGVPSVSLSYGLNPIDETIIPRIRTNHPLDARSVDARFLAEVLERRLAETASAAAHPCPEFQPGGSARAAAELARFVREHAG
jgi:UDP-N-acetylglucosamine:LPS N-acetylglucosamine transferase